MNSIEDDDYFISKGEGVFSTIKDFGNNLIYGRKGYSPSMMRILEKYGAERIIKIEIQRNPLNWLLTGVLNAFTMGELAKNNPYDKLFHLKIVITTDKGHRFALEKTQVIGMVLDPKPNTGMEGLVVPITHYLTTNELLENTKKLMGDDFLPYSAKDNNCQDFIISILKANELDSPENTKFIKQDIVELFAKIDNENNIYRKTINTLTDLAGRANVLYEGGGLSSKNGLYTEEVNELLQDVKDFNGTFSKDRLPNPIKAGWYVINMEDFKDGNGTHYTCFKIPINSKNPIIYSDSFGFPPPNEVMKLAKPKQNILYSTKQIQDIRSTACGWFCVACILSDNSKDNTSQHFTKYLAHFSNNTLVNDNILYNILRKYNLV